MRRFQPAVLALMLGAACAPARTASVSGSASLAIADDGIGSADPAVADDHTPAGDAPAGEAPAPEAVAPEVSDAPWVAVRSVDVERAGTGRRVTIALTRAPDGLREFLLGKPPRLVIDLEGPHAPDAQREARFPLTDSVVSRARVAAHEGRLRIVLDLGRSLRQHAVRADGATLIAELGDTSDPVAEAAPPEPAVEPVAYVASAAEPAPAPAAEPAPPPVVEAAPRRPLDPPPPPVADPPAPDPAPEVEPAPAPPLPPRRAAVPRPKEHHATPATGGTAGFNGERISLDFKDADIQNVLRVLADVSHLNIIATDDVKGKVTLHLVDVPWDQALDLVLRSNRLEMSRQGNVVRISTVARLKEEREALRAAQDAERELEPLRVKYVKVNYARADDSLVDKVKGVLSERGSVTFDDRTNTIIVRDIPHGLQDAGELIQQLDTQSPQVLIEANIVEATEDFARGLGVQWGYRFNAGPQTGNPTGLNFPGTVGLGGSGLGTGSPTGGLNGAPARGLPFLADFPIPGNFGSGFGANNGSALDLALGSLDGSQALTARLTALEEQGKGKVVSRPRVITMNNVAATIQSLTILRVKLPSTGTVINTGTGGAAGSASTATEKINTGITLVVTPQVSQDGFVLMSIYAKSSQPDFTHTVDNIPNEVSREANSNVLIKDGETVVLGGIYRNTSNDAESGLPYLRRIPALGWLFKRLLRSHHHEELLVFLTPKVVSPGAVQLPPAERLWEERRQGG